MLEFHLELTVFELAVLDFAVLEHNVFIIPEINKFLCEYSQDNKTL